MVTLLLGVVEVPEPPAVLQQALGVEQRDRRRHVVGGDVVAGGAQRLGQAGDRAAALAQPVEQGLHRAVRVVDDEVVADVVHDPQPVAVAFPHHALQPRFHRHDATSRADPSAAAGGYRPCADRARLHDPGPLLPSAYRPLTGAGTPGHLLSPAAPGSARTRGVVTVPPGDLQLCPGYAALHLL